MKDIAIKVENPSKAYRLGFQAEKAETLVDRVNLMGAPLRNFRWQRLNTFSTDRESEDILWALKEDRQEGRREGEATLLRRRVVRRFGALPSWAEERLALASLAPLETWGDRVLEAATLTEVLSHPEH